MTDPIDGIPDGFLEVPTPGAFNHSNGPFRAKRIGRALLFGLRVEPRHANAMGTCHGAMLMMLADIQLPMAARYQAGLDDAFLPTVNLTGDFLASPKLGDWIEGTTDVVRVTRNLVFAHGVLSVAGEPVFRANGIFKRVGPPPPGVDDTMDLRRIFGAPD